MTSFLGIYIEEHFKITFWQRAFHHSSTTTITFSRFLLVHENNVYSYWTQPVYFGKRGNSMWGNAYRKNLVSYFYPPIIHFIFFPPSFQLLHIYKHFPCYLLNRITMIMMTPRLLFRSPSTFHIKDNAISPL